MLDKSAFDIIGPYYTNASGADGHVPGRICEARVYYFPPGPLRVLKFDYEAANRGDPIKYEVGQHTETSFHHIPVRLPVPLEWDEAFGVVTVTNRRVLLLSHTIQQPRGAPKQDFPPCHLVCPLFRFHDTHLEEFRLRVQAWEYDWLFHLPPSDEFGVIEGFLRLDRIVAIPLGQLRLTDVKLTDDAFLGLQECLSSFVAGTMESHFAEYRRLLIEELNRVLSQTKGGAAPS